jgi:hypothetical protein
MLILALRKTDDASDAADRTAGAGPFARPSPLLPLCFLPALLWREMSIRDAHVSTGHILSESARHSCAEAAIRDLLDNAIAHGGGWGATQVTISAGTPTPLEVRARARAREGARGACEGRARARARQTRRGICAKRQPRVPLAPQAVAVASRNIAHAATQLLAARSPHRLRRACVARTSRLTRAPRWRSKQGDFCCVRDNGKGMTEEQLHLGLLGRGRAPPAPGGGAPAPSSPGEQGDIIRFFGTGYAVWMAHLATEGVGATVTAKTNTGTLFRNVRYAYFAPRARALRHATISLYCADASRAPCVVRYVSMLHALHAAPRTSRALRCLRRSCGCWACARWSTRFRRRSSPST